jgi:hypothetical protein
MSRLTGQLNLGLRWLTCGRRIFFRNPMLLGGMGLWVVSITAILTWVPFVGGMLIAFLAPLLLGGFYLVINGVTQQRMSRPVLLYKRAIKQSLRDLFCVFREEKRVVPAVVAALYCTVGALLASVLVQFTAGGNWAKEWTSLGTASLWGVIAVGVGVLVIYFLLAWPMVYGLPLAFLEHQPLFPAMRRSVKAVMRHIFGLLVILGFMLLPILAAIAASFISMWLAYGVALLLGTVMVPIVMAGLYCSFRTVFPQKENLNQPVRARQHTLHRSRV